MFEHKSYIPKYLHLQLLQYILNGLNQQAKEKKRKKLTLILPFVIAHANRKWKVKPLWEYFELPTKDFIKFIPNFEYLLTDLFAETDESIEEMTVGMLLSTFLLFKHRGDGDYLKTYSEKVFIYWKAYRDTESGRMFTKAISTYIRTNYPIDRKGLYTIIENVPEPIKNELMMLGERLILDGKIEGKIEGENRKESEFILRLFKLRPEMTDLEVVLLVGTTEKRVLELRKKWTKAKSNLQKASLLIKLFSDWEIAKIAEFGNIPMEEMDGILKNIQPDKK